MCYNGSRKSRGTRPGQETVRALTEEKNMNLRKWLSLMLCVMCICFGSLATISMDDLKAMLIPLVVTLIVGAIFIIGFGSIMGRILKVDWRLAAAIAICCTIGYPGTQIITEEVCRTLDCDEELRAKIHDHVLPPIIVSGFTTVTIASVFFAGFIIPLIF